MTQPQEISRVAGFGSRRHIVRDGGQLTWAEMSVSHLRNAAEWIKHHAIDETAAIMRCSFQGEMAQDAQQSALNAAWDREFAAVAVSRDMHAYADWREQHHPEPKRAFREFTKV
jgi:hypothetical protein